MQVLAQTLISKPTEWWLDKGTRCWRCGSDMDRGRANKGADQEVSKPLPSSVRFIARAEAREWNVTVPASYPNPVQR